MRHAMLVGIIILSGFATIFGDGAMSDAQGDEVRFVEDFSLALDREDALKQLIPGTEDYYYWNCIHLLNTQQLDRVEEVLKQWVPRHGETARVWQIRTRRAMLAYEGAPQQTLDYLTNRFGIHFPHQKEELNADPDLPIALDADLISRKQFRHRAMRSHKNSLNGFEDSAFEWLIHDELTPDQRRSLLERLSRPDHAGLASMVAADLNHPKSKGFGSFNIHNQLLKEQLDELLKLKSDLLNQQAFVRAYLTKLRPGPDVDWRHAPQEMAAYLDRLQAFADRLEPVHNSLKAHVRYHRLLLDRSQGKYDKSRFLAYLKLPRATRYISKQMRESEELKRFACDLNSNYDSATQLPPIHDDEPLVRSYLAHFFVDADNIDAFEPFVNDVYLKHLFAETKIVNGLGDQERWASLLPPEPFRQLKERVDIDFDFSNNSIYDVDDAVTLDLHVKNVSTLIVKVFEVNAENYYRQTGTEVDTDINLDGLVANFEQTHKYTDPPLRRAKHTFAFPMLKDAGIYVVDFIGNGQSSRALIRKGRLRHLVHTTPAGQSFTILDEDNQQVKDARIWLAGHEYKATKNGSIDVPFSTKPGRQSIVITAPLPGGNEGTYSSLSHFQHAAESYQFTAGFYVAREALLKDTTAELVVRPGLSVNGTPVSLELLEEVKLTITSTDLDGTSSTVELPKFLLFEDRETVHEFQVPPRLATLQLRLSAKITQVITGKKVDVADAATFSLNGIDRTEKIEDMHLLKSADQYVLEVLGRTGEPKVSRPIALTFKHRDFRNVVHTVLKSDPQGRIMLGDLADIVSLTAKGPHGTAHAWSLVGGRHTYARTVHARVGEPITLPYLGQAKKPARNELSLLELSGSTFGIDRFDHLEIQDGLVVIKNLPAGDFDLLLKATNTRIALRVAEGEQIGSFIVGSLRQLETKPLKTLQIESIKTTKKQLAVQLRNVSKFARVHIYATRYMPEYDVFRQLSSVHGAEPYLYRQTPAESVYLTGRNIGDEYRYIIDRKYANKYPGNMLERPSLLLNPWAVRDTETGEQLAGAGEQYAQRGARPESAAEREPTADAQQARKQGNFANLDFLAKPAAVVLNLLPDEKGIVEVPLELFGTHQHIEVVAIDPLHTTCRSLTLPEPVATIVDLRMLKNLSPSEHFTQQKQISIVPAGTSFTLHDISTAKLESYDSLSRVFTLFATLSGDPKLAEFSFILTWPDLPAERKRELYSKFASHELSFFLFKKDPEFFRTVVQPYLANKKDKTFLDHFLLEDDLRDYLLPWNYGQLNTVERILLARRIDGEHEHTSRHIGDRFALLPPNVDRFNHLFDTAVQRSALEVGDSLGLKDALLAFETRRDALTREKSVVVSLPLLAAESRGFELGTEVTGGSRRQENKAQRRYKGSKAKLGEAKQRLSEAESLDGLRELVESDEAFYDDSIIEKRKQLRQLYRQIEKTQEWAENNYYHLAIGLHNAELITVNKFWKDFAAHNPAHPFLSPNLAEASRNFPEMMLALAVLDLPFDAPKHATTFEETQMTLVPGGPLVVFHEEIRPATAPDAEGRLLVSQNFFKHNDRQRIVNGEQVDKYVTDEFLIHTVYGCQIVITNPTSTRQKLNILTQIPRGAIAVLGSKPTSTSHIDLEPYHTQTVEYHFYFPAAGQFPHFPVHVAKNERLIAVAEPASFSVVDRPTKVDTGSWSYISQHGTVDDVVTYLTDHNIDNVALDRIAWRMQDAEAFERILPLLAARHVYSHTLWSYALKHDAVTAAREYLQHADNIVKECGGPLQSKLVTIDPVVRRTYEHLEYKPLVNARAHTLGRRRQIVNDRLHWQYHRFLTDLAFTRTLDDDQLLTVTYYLLLQDRVEEALAAFARVKRDNIVTQMQYDYCAAYLKFFTDQPEQARSIAEKYADHPVDRWRKTFAVIAAQLDEATGRSVDAVDALDRNQQQGQLAATEPGFDLEIEARTIRVSYQNLAKVKVNFYEIDVELLFSRNPFIKQFGDNFASIKPNVSLDVELPQDKHATVVELPESLRNSNMLIEVVGAGDTKTQAHFSNSLAVQVIENYGQIKVTHRNSRQSVAKAYVKVYARSNQGEVKFFKDGYTDLRGRFDYASLSTNELDSVASFSVLVLSDEHGALVREAAPPKQ